MSDGPVVFPNDAVLNAEEVSDYLRIHRDRVYALLSENSIPHFRDGRSYRIPFWSLREWVAQRACAPYVPVPVIHHEAGRLEH